MSRSRGETLVELLVATALGLAVTVLGLGQWGRHLREHHGLSTELRLARDLNAAADAIARDLRRTGYWGDAAAGIWQRAAAPSDNPYAGEFAPAGPVSAAQYAYSRDEHENGTLDTNERFGVRLRAGAVELRIGESGWQAMTDRETLAVTALTLVPTLRELPLADTCPRPCASGAADCPPVQQIRLVTLSLSGRASADPAIERSVQRSVRLRNDTIVGRCSG